MAELEIIQVEKSNEPMGIKVNKDKIVFLLPKVYQIPQDENVLRKELLRFVCSLALANTREYANTAQVIDESLGTSWPVLSFLWIIRDFLENGIFYSREKQFTNDSKGKIDWKRTLKTVPVISSENIIYDHPVTSRIMSTEDIISQIYKVCLKISVDCFGWAFNYNIPVEVNRTKTVAEMSYVIKKELSATFDDIKKIRYRHMLAILQGIDDNNLLSSEYTYTITNYYYVFETMVDILLDGIKGDEKLKYNPKAKWNLMGVASNDGPAPLRPDTIYKKDDSNIYIFDSKMYKFGFSADEKDLPGTDSIQKQITYGDHIFFNVLGKKGHVSNSFILPYNKALPMFKNNVDIEKYMEGNIVYVGYAEPTWREFSDERYNFIHTILIDFNYLLSNYDSKTSTIIDEICKIIDSKNI